MAKQTTPSMDLPSIAWGIGFRARSARAVARQVEEVLPNPSPDQYERANEAGYLLAVVVELLDMVSRSAEELEVALKTAQNSPSNSCAFPA